MNPESASGLERTFWMSEAKIVGSTNSYKRKSNAWSGEVLEQGGVCISFIQVHICLPGNVAGEDFSLYHVRAITFFLKRWILKGFTIHALLHQKMLKMPLFFLALRTLRLSDSIKLPFCKRKRIKSSTTEWSTIHKYTGFQTGLQLLWIFQECFEFSKSA